MTKRSLPSGLFSDLDLNGDVPPITRPMLGDWGPDLVPSTRQKQRLRVIVPIAFVVALGAVGAFWYYFWLALG